MALLRQENSESDVSVDLGSRREHELRSDGDVPRLFLLEYLVRYYIHFLSYRVKGPLEQRKEGLHGGFSDHRALF